MLAGMSNLFLFLVFLPWTEARTLKHELWYFVANPLKHLKIKIASYSASVEGTESNLRSFNTGVICSYFLVPVRILAAKFWIFCNLRTLVLL